MSNRILGVALALFACTCISVQADEAPLLQRSLFSDRTAVHQGDILTVLITEAAAASETARTSTDKSDSVAGDLRHSGHEPWHIDLGLNNDFSGGGQIQRTGKLLGKLAVRVKDIDANGNLSIYGEQDIHINNEKQRIGLSGWVRSDDVAPDNTVDSWRIADAKIEFKGDGVLARKQRPGLLSRLFDLFGLN